MNMLVRGACVRLALAGVLLAALYGCRSNPNDDMIDVDLNGDDGTTMEETTGEGLPNIDQGRLIFEPWSALQTVYFDYDSSALRPDALNALRRNADVIKQTPGYVIQVEGHCDERGTQEYNLALGERRALAVRAHLISLGVSGDRMVTISYGEEAPAVMGTGEAVWSQNRRAEFSRAPMQ